MKVEGTQYYQSARFMPGILEYQFMSGKTGERAQQIARVIHEYETAFDAKIGPTTVNYPAWVTPLRLIFCHVLLTITCAVALALEQSILQWSYHILWVTMIRTIPDRG